MTDGTDDTAGHLPEREAVADEYTRLAERVATTPHDALTPADVETFDQFLDTVDEALAGGDTTIAAAHLASFWKAHLQAGLQAETDTVPSDTGALAEEAHAAGLVGIDLYQALMRFFDVWADAEASDDTPAALENWAKRIVDLTVELSDHVADHHQ